MTQKKLELLYHMTQKHNLSLLNKKLRVDKNTSTFLYSWLDVEGHFLCNTRNHDHGGLGSGRLKVRGGDASNGSGFQSLKSVVILQLQFLGLECRR